MKTVTSDFLKAQSKESIKPITRVYYKRRYWNGSNAYIWEANWTELPRDEIVGVDSVVHALDSQTLNEFLISNTVIRARNNKMQWKEGSHTDSKFKPDGTAVFGYEPYLMKFQVRTGLIVGETDTREGVRLSEGLEELLTIFTGVGVEFWTDSDERVSYIRATGLEEILANGDAENVSTSVTLESAGVGDGSSLEFSTVNVGVGIVSLVKVGSLTMTEGHEYSVSDLNDADIGATISFIDPPPNGDSVTVSYKYWKKNRSIVDLITDLLIESGIGSYSLSPIDVGNLNAIWTQTVKSDFDSGTKTAIDTDTIEDSYQIDYLSDDARTAIGDFNSGGTPATYGYTQVDGVVGGTPAWSVAGGKLHWSCGGVSSGRWQVKTGLGTTRYGVWEFKVKFNDANAVGYVYFAADQNPGTYPRGYGIRWTSSGSFFRLVRADGSSETVIDSVILIPTVNQEYIVKITRDITDEWNVYVDGALQLTATDSTYTSHDRICIGGENNSGSSTTIDYDDIFFPQATFIGILLSQVLDGGSGLVSWDSLSWLHSAGSGSLTYQTRVSTDNVSYDADVTVSSSGDAITSSDKRYLRVEITLSVTNPNIITANRPIGRMFKVKYTTTEVPVVLGIFNQLSCYQAIQELAKLADYEWGFDDSETFFFRPRDASLTPDVTFTNGDNLLEVLSLTNGYDKVFSIVRARFGEFIAEESASADVRTSVYEIFGKRVFNISSNVLINKDVNLAEAMASIYLDRLGTVKRRVRILTKYYPQIELSDTVSISYYHDRYTEGLEPYISTLICKIIYASHDIMTAVSEFECEEIV